MEAHVCQADDLNPATWRDPKRYAWLLGLLVPLLPFMAWGLVELTGLGLLWFWGPIFVFGLMPVLDTMIGKDSANPPDSVVKWLEQDRYYRWCTYAYIPLQYLAIFGGAWLLAAGGLSVVEKIGPQNHRTPRPVSSTRPQAMNGSSGTSRPSSQA